MHSAADGRGNSTYNGPGGPYDLTIAGVPLNPVPEIWAGMTPRGSLS
jgi:hypothetical protein